MQMTYASSVKPVELQDEFLTEFETSAIAEIILDYLDDFNLAIPTFNLTSVHQFAMSDVTDMEEDFRSVIERKFEYNYYFGAADYKNLEADSLVKKKIDYFIEDFSDRGIGLVSVIIYCDEVSDGLTAVFRLIQWGTN